MTTQLMSTLSRADTDRFREALRGPLLLPEDAAYDETRMLWNRFIDRRPALIVRAAGINDIRQAVNFAHEHDLPVSMRGGGHSYPGHSVGDGSLMLDLSTLKGIRVDPARRRVRADAGVLWGELDRETHGFGLAVPGGQVSRVGVAGLTLGGGFGWLMRKWGLTIDNLISADVVGADGQLRTASADENADLFWALRGGGGNFGVVTSFEFQAQEVSTVYGGLMLYPLAAAQTVLRGYWEFAASAPDELTTSVAFLTPPNGQPCVGIAFCYAGDPQTGERLTRPLHQLGPVVMEQVGPKPYPAHQMMMDHTIPPGSRLQIRSNFLDDLADGLVTVLADRYKGAPLPLSSIVMIQLGGAVRRVDPQATAFYHRQASYTMYLFATWATAAQDSQNVDWLQAFWQDVQPYLGQGVYVNTLFDEGPARVRQAYGPAHDRLLALKRKYDPDNLFRVNQNIA